MNANLVDRSARTDEIPLRGKLHPLCRFPVRVWRDEDTQKIRMDTYNGVNTLITDKVIPLTSTALM